MLACSVTCTGQTLPLLFTGHQIVDYLFDSEYSETVQWEKLLVGRKVEAVW